MTLLRWSRTLEYVTGFAALVLGFWTDNKWLLFAALFVLALAYDTTPALKPPAWPTSERDIELESQLRAIHVEWMGKDTLSNLDWLESEIELAYSRWDKWEPKPVPPNLTEDGLDLDESPFEGIKMEREWR